MGNVISFDERKRKIENEANFNKKKSKIVTGKATIDDSRTAVNYADMEPDEQIEYWKNIEKEEDERFRCKYSGVLTVVPVTAGERMKYSANVMLQLIPNIFHGSSWDIQFETWLDFCEFYLSKFDPAYGDYSKANKEFEQPYHYKFGAMKAEKLEEELLDCLGKIIALYPEKTDADKTAMMYQAARLFELQDLLSDLFYKQVIKD